MAVDHDTLIGWLSRLKLTAIRDQLDNLLDEASRADLTHSRDARIPVRTRDCKEGRETHHHGDEDRAFPACTRSRGI